MTWSSIAHIAVAHSSSQPWRNAVARAGAIDGANATLAMAQIIAGAIRYRDDPNRLPEFTKYAEGWLNGDGWEDEPLPVRGLDPREQAQRIDADRRRAEIIEDVRLQLVEYVQARERLGDSLTYQRALILHRQQCEENLRDDSTGPWRERLSWLDQLVTEEGL